MTWWPLSNFTIFLYTKWIIHEANVFVKTVSFFSTTSYLHYAVAKIVQTIPMSIGSILMRLRERAGHSSDVTWWRLPIPLSRTPNSNCAVVRGGDENPRVNWIPSHAVHSSPVSTENGNRRLLFDVIDVHLSFNTNNQLIGQQFWNDILY